MYTTPELAQINCEDLRQWYICKQNLNSKNIGRPPISQRISFVDGVQSRESCRNPTLNMTRYNRSTVTFNSVLRCQPIFICLEVRLLLPFCIPGLCWPVFCKVNLALTRSRELIVTDVHFRSWNNRLFLKLDLGDCRGGPRSRLRRRFCRPFRTSA